MSAIVASESLASFLQAMKDRTEIRAADGKVLGVFTPSSILVQKGLVPGKQYTTREAFEHLLSLTNDPQDRATLERHIEEIKRRDACAGQ